MNWYLLLNLWWLFLPLGFLAVGAVGVLLDAEHRKNLAWRRGNVTHMLITDTRLPAAADPSHGCRLVTGEIVLSANRLITAAGSIKQIFGGEVKSFSDLVVRAREEATLRVLEQAASLGFDSVCNFRIEPVDVANVQGRSASQKSKGVYASFVAYGTAYTRAAGVYPPVLDPSPPLPVAST